MKKIGVFYSFRSKKSAAVAGKIIEQLGKDRAVAVDVDAAWGKDFMGFDSLIFGVPTWFDGELPYYWDELVPLLEDMDFSGKKVAVFGNGNQKDYPENFGDAVGIMAEVAKSAGAEIVGFTSTEGYSYELSKADVGSKQFCGLILDFENQATLSDKRIADWVHLLISEF